MRIDHLFEGPDEDVAHYEQADAILSALIRHFMDESRAPYGLLGVQMQGEMTARLMGEAIKDLPPEHRRLIFYFGQGWGRGMHSYRVSDNRPVIIIKTLHDDPLKNDVVRDAVIHGSMTKKVLRHELAHYIDFDVQRQQMKRSLSSYPPEDKRRGADYTNHPVEFNAYFMNVAEKLLRFLSMVKKSPEMAPKLAEVFKISTNFEETVRELLQTTGFMAVNEFIRLLRTGRRRRLLSRLYKLHQQAVTAIENAA